jgi:hypothetical protein
MHQHEFEWEGRKYFITTTQDDNTVVGVHTAGKRTVPLDLFYLVSDAWLRGNPR